MAAAGILDGYSASTVVRAGEKVELQRTFDTKKEESITSLAFSPDGKTLAGGTFHAVVCWERWAKWTAVGLVVVLVAYPLSFGPMCWLNSQPVTTKKLRRPPLAMIIYLPLCELASSNTVMGHALMWWVHFGLERGRCTMLPRSVSDLGELSYSDGKPP
jgi:hypothetical protein